MRASDPEMKVQSPNHEPRLSAEEWSKRMGPMVTKPPRAPMQERGK
jgi:hypothetical protein